MRPENRTRRETEIFKAAYRVLDLSGPEGLTMLSVARAARASRPRSRPNSETSRTRWMPQWRSRPA